MGSLTQGVGSNAAFGDVYQIALGTNGVTVAGKTRVRLANVDFIGLNNGGAFANNNDAVRINNSSNVTLNGIFATGWNGAPVRFNGVTNAVLTNITGTASSDGVRFTSSQNITVASATLDAPQTATFIAGYTLDSTNGGNTVCKDIAYSVCSTKDYANAQAYLIHAGIRVSITGGVHDNSLIGVGITAFNNTDTIQDITIAGVVFNMTSTAGGAAAPVGITAFGFDNTHLAEQITAIGCIVRNANNMVTVQTVDNGAIEGQYVKALTLIGNSIIGGMANGYAFYRRVQDLTLIGGSVADVGIFGAENNGARFGENGSGWMAATGEVSGVHFRNLGAGIRFTTIAAAACTIARAGTTATLHKVAHGFLVGDWIRVSGVTFAAPADGYYNGTFQVATVIGADDITYTMAVAPTNAAALGAPVITGSYDGLSIHDNFYENVTTPVINPDYALTNGNRTYVAGDKAPWLGKADAMTIANASAVAITTFRGPVLGKTTVFTFLDVNTTITNGANIKTVAAGNIVSAIGMQLAFKCTDDATPIWSQVSVDTAT